MDAKVVERKTAKHNLREALSQSRGDLKAKPVSQAISQLTALNPTRRPTEMQSLLEGSWLLMNAPRFSGGKRTKDGKYIHTLGRLSSNFFQPTHLSVSINRVIQRIVPMTSNNQLTYNIEIEFTTLDSNFPQMQGVLRNKGQCIVQNDQILQVKFMSEELAPIESENPELMEHWISVFKNQKSLKSLNIGQNLQGFIAKNLFGLERSQGIETQTGKLSLFLNKSPQETLKILYLDAEIRITRGKRGTVTIYQRI